MNTLARLIISSFFILSISACSTKDSSAAKTQTQHKLPEVIHGYRLPPEPDPKINNSTLLGIDSNNNGVRDDLERWIVFKYAKSDYPKHKTAIAMQWGRVVQQILQNPQSAYEDKKYLLVDKAQECRNIVYKKLGKSLRYRGNNIIFNDDFKDKAFNTKERMAAWWQFNGSLSGHIYDNRSFENQCDFDTDSIIEEKYKELEDKGIVPKLDRSDDLAGPDMDNNGIRDDVDDYINKKYTNPKEKAAAWQMARAYQEILLIDKNNSTEVEALSEKVTKAVVCTTDTNISIRRNIKAITFNTKARVKEYFTFDNLLDGTVSTMPEGDTCEK